MSTAFEKLKQKSLQGTSTQSPVSTDIPVSAFDRLKTKGATPAIPTEENKGSAVGNFLKGVVSAPATLIARPFQAAADFGDYLGTELALKGQTPEVQAMIRADANERLQKRQTESSFGGIVAPTPKDTSDVVKDIGRGVQTVALGAGAPLASGAAFGFGGALENQGSNILSKEGITDALVSTLVGMGAGKALDLVGKPLLNAAGKVIGTITPQVLKDVATKGSSAVENFMAHHEIVPAGVKPAINAIPKVAETFDTEANKLFKGTGTAVKSAVQGQYPGLTKDNLAKHYENVEVDRLLEPTKTPGATFRNAAEVANDAKKRGIDLKKLAADNKIYASDHITEGKFATQDTVNALRDEAMSGGKEILRPALQAAEPGVQKVPMSEIRAEIMSRLNEVPDAKLSPEQKLKFARNIAKEYADNSIAAASHPGGYSLTNLYDSKLQTGSNLYKSPKTGGVQSISDSLTAQQKQIESQVFGDLLKKSAPTELGLDKYFKAQEGRFMLADYLESLNTRKAPQTLFQRGVRKAAQLGGATTGASVAGPFGMFSGYQFGGIVADTFANASNPVKVAYLKSIGKSEPEIYQIMKDFVKKSELDKLLRPKLEASTTIFQGPTQGGKPYTPNKAGFTTTPVVETKKVPLKDIYKKK